MASKGEAAKNTRYESAKHTRTREAAEKTTHRIVGKEDSASVASRSRSRISVRSDHSGGSRTRAKLSESATKQRSGSIVKSTGKCPPVKTLSDKMRCAPDHGSGRETKTRNTERCDDRPYRHVPQVCTKPKKWQNGMYCRDDCGSGIVSKKFAFKQSRDVWCNTPLTMYQATIGELGRQILCREKIIARDVKPEPPCNVCEYIMPPCRGYYRRYDCVRPCEEDYVAFKQGKKYYRDRVERYWEPCEPKDKQINVDINTFAHHNVFLGEKLRRKFDEAIPCW